MRRIGKNLPSVSKGMKNEYGYVPACFGVMCVDCCDGSGVCVCVCVCCDWWVLLQMKEPKLYA